jgi:acyl-CoA synthetase (AMP-forming)/AMP-acid ligase II
MRMCVGGAMGVSMDRWDATSAAMLVERYSVTSTAGAPVMLSELLDLEASGSCNLSSLRSYMTGAANVPPSLVTRAERAGIRAFRCYGLSEHPTISSGIVDDPLERRSSTDGRLIDGSQVRILSETDEDLRFGQVGDIVSRGPELFVGYRDPRLNDAAFLSGGWFRTGDMGYMDAEGFLTVTDRRKDIIIRGGENISSMEVEDLLAQVPGVAEAAVVPIPHARLGESVCAYIITRPGAQVTLEAVIEHFRNAGVARQKTPERLEVVDAFPRTAAGKVKKFELRDRLR